MTCQNSECDSLLLSIGVPAHQSADGRVDDGGERCEDACDPHHPGWNTEQRLITRRELQRQPLIASFPDSTPELFFTDVYVV